MNSKDKKWIKDWLYKIYVEDLENDGQADDINDFHCELMKLVDFKLPEEK